MDFLDLHSFRKQHQKYLSSLGDFFHYSSSEQLARLLSNNQYKPFIQDYLKMVCLPGFVENVEKQRAKILEESKLESSAQSSPKCIEESPEPIEYGGEHPFKKDGDGPTPEKKYGTAPFRLRHGLPINGSTGGVDIGD